jgi:hypothetical protein
MPRRYEIKEVPYSDRAAKLSRPDIAAPTERAVHAPPVRKKEVPYSGGTDGRSRTAGRPEAAVTGTNFLRRRPTSNNAPKPEMRGA